jgi:hypothetical protein
LSSSAVWSQQKRFVVALAHLSCTRKLRSFAFAPLSNSVLLLLLLLLISLQSPQKTSQPHSSFVALYKTFFFDLWRLPEKRSE